jgi:hypothetical protein
LSKGVFFVRNGAILRSPEARKGLRKTDPAADPVDSGYTTSRRELVQYGSLAAAGLALGAGVGTLVRVDAAAAAPSKAQDRKIFNFALLLEYVQAAFYSEAVRRKALSGDVLRFAQIVSGHERAHVEYLRKALGADARAEPKLDFGNATRDQRAFLEAAVLLENLGVVAYNGQAANLTKPALAAAAEIVSVEGRHAAWISDLAGKPPAPRAADVGASSVDVIQALQSTHFIKTK